MLIILYIMNVLNVPDRYVESRGDGEIAYSFNLVAFTHSDKVRFEVNGLKTSWLSIDDDFIKRIQFENLNKSFISKHLAKEIEIRNILDEGAGLLDDGKYRKAIGCFDEVIYYDEDYGRALLFKSRALFGQGHFVKALRYYRKALNADSCLEDIEYHKRLVHKANEERDSFPKIKRHIYMGDEHFGAGEFRKAVESYGKALADPSKFKSKILPKLLNKKATALFELHDIDNALKCFEKSLDISQSDYAIFMRGRCEYELDLDLDDSFFCDLRISKPQQLSRAMILNGIGMQGEAIECIDNLLSNHFAQDELYIKAVECRNAAIDSLNNQVI